MLSIGIVGFIVGDDIHLVMWESVGDVIAGVTRGGCVVLLARVVLCHTAQQRTVLPLSLLASHAYVPLLGKGTVPCNILENILQVPLSGHGIKVLWMMKEEQHNWKVEQLMKFLQLSLVALLSRAVRNDLRNQQFAKQKEQIVSITGR
jgi:hypothetical protein